MGNTERVLLDANVWYSRTLCDWFSLLHLQGDRPPFTILWTEDILAEARYHLRRNSPETNFAAIDWRFDSIRQGMRGGRVSDFDIKNKGHPDKDDWHVVNAAIEGGAGYLVTQDGKFSDLDEDSLPFEIHTPDSFLIMLDDSHPNLIRTVTREQQDYYISKKKPFSLPKMLQKAEANDFSERVAQHLRIAYG